jgi:hypothetical protein
MECAHQFLNYGFCAPGQSGGSCWHVAEDHTADMCGTLGCLNAWQAIGLAVLYAVLLVPNAGDEAILLVVGWLAKSALKAAPGAVRSVVAAVEKVLARSPKAVADGDVTLGRLTIDAGKQDKHIPGTNNFIPGRSELTVDPGSLLSRAGSGQPLNSVPRGTAGFRERVDFGRVIGRWSDGAGTFEDTTVGIIHYGSNGTVHIVPARPVP